MGGGCSLKLHHFFTGKPMFIIYKFWCHYLIVIFTVCMSMCGNTHLIVNPGLSNPNPKICQPWVVTTQGWRLGGYFHTCVCMTCSLQNCRGGFATSCYWYIGWSQNVHECYFLWRYDTSVSPLILMYYFSLLSGPYTISYTAHKI